MKKLFLFGLISAVLFSCSSNDQPVTDTTIGTDATVNSTVTEAQTTTTTTAPGTVPLTNATVPAMTATKPGVVTQQNISAASAQSSNAGINPTHGQPGHRCDISVGAPLNSPAAKPQSNITQMTKPAPANQITTTQAAPTPTAPGMNPPHGQPGHRCDISAGAPLNSAPNKPAATTTPATIQSVERQDAKTIITTPQ
ncbi:MAG: hypothetical protein WKF88_05980 [Ferruginibacter sp.]